MRCGKVSEYFVLLAAEIRCLSKCSLLTPCASVLTGQCHLPGGDDVQDDETFHVHETRLVQAGGDQVRASGFRGLRLRVKPKVLFTIPASS